jgi:ketopantoate reductase
MKKIAVIGAGALGGMYAARFFDNDPESVFLVAGGDRKRRLQSEGFLSTTGITSCRRPSRQGPRRRRT